MNKIDHFFKRKKDILSVYFTAGFPNLNDTTDILKQLEKAGAEMIEIGIPFSDPLADGPIIQRANEIALQNGMTLKILFDQLYTGIIRNSQIPILLMGYLNPILQFGMERFCKQANQCGVSGAIIPDLPVEEYLNEYHHLFRKYNLKNIFLITPQTPEKRVRMIDTISDGFIYAVSSASTTGTKMGLDDEKEKFFRKIRKMNLKNSVMIGFGISDRQSFLKACEYADGAIIGSAFIHALQNATDISSAIVNFIKSIKQ